MKTSKVTSANFTGRTWQGQSGLIHYHAIVFENGDSGEYGSLSQVQDKFVVGQEATYEITPNGQYAPKIKPVQQNGKGGGFKQRTDPKTMIASYAKDIVIAYINNGHKVEQKWFADWADYIEAWVNGGEAKPPQIPSSTKPGHDDDLPF